MKTAIHGSYRFDLSPPEQHSAETCWCPAVVYSRKCGLESVLTNCRCLAV